MYQQQRQQHQALESSFEQQRSNAMDNTGIMGGVQARSAQQPRVPGMYNPNNPSDMTRQNVPQQQTLTGAPNPNYSYQGPSSVPSSFNGGAGLQTPSNYDAEGFRNMAEGFSQFYAIPYANMVNADRTAAMNEAFGSFDRAEQQRVNTHQMGLADRASGREDTALDFSMLTNRRDFTESVRQADRAYGLDRDRFGLESEIARGQLNQGDFANQTNRMEVEGRIGNDRFANETQRQAVNMQNAIAQEQNRIAQYEAQTGRIDIEGRQRLEEFANQTARMSVQGQLDLGQGDLRFRNRELEMTEGRLREQMAQEAALAREQMRNQLIQARYGAFGRAAVGNPRAMTSWY